jgi:hypothetical protein
MPAFTARAAPYGEALTVICGGKGWSQAFLHLRERLVDPKAIHDARALLAEQIGKFTLEQVSENGEVSFNANGQIDFFGEEALHAWVVPGEGSGPNVCLFGLSGRRRLDVAT